MTQQPLASVSHRVSAAEGAAIYQAFLAWRLGRRPYVGTASSPGNLTVSGNFVENPFQTINVLGASTLTFGTGGNSSALADLKGALNLTANGSGNPTVSNAQELRVDGGTLTSTLGGGPVGNVITGDVGVFNTGTVTVGGASILSLTRGSLTVGSAAPGLVSIGGTLNISNGASLSFPPAAGVSSTFVVQGGGASAAVVNMNGATIAMSTARVGSLDLDSIRLSECLVRTQFMTSLGINQPRKTRKTRKASQESSERSATGWFS